MSNNIQPEIIQKFTGEIQNDLSKLNELEILRNIVRRLETDNQYLKSQINSNYLKRNTELEQELRESIEDYNVLLDIKNDYSNRLNKAIENITSYKNEIIILEKIKTDLSDEVDYLSNKNDKLKKKNKKLLKIINTINTGE
jgi:chromosome segregation ATPase